MSVLKLRLLTLKRLQNYGYCGLLDRIQFTLIFSILYLQYLFAIGNHKNVTQKLSFAKSSDRIKLALGDK